MLPPKIVIIPTQSAAPCMSGAIGIETVPPPSTAFCTKASGVSGTGPPMASSGARVERKKSRWYHITPFGMPVVPPV